MRNQPKRQHWIPMFYLRYFAISSTTDSQNPQVWAFHRKEGDPLILNATKIAVKKFAYSPLTENGTRDFRRERELSDLENTLSKIWPELANDFVDLESGSIRKGISLFLATLFLRHPYTFAMQREIRVKLLEMARNAPQDDDGLPNIKGMMIGSEFISFDKHKWKSLADANFNDEHRFFADTIRVEAIGVAERLMEKRWSMGYIDEPLFVTSDNPFFVIDQHMKRNQILGKNAKLMFPVSPTRILCLDDLDEPRGQYYKLRSDQAGLYNYLTWVNTDGYMISPRCIDQVLREIEEIRQQHAEIQ